jgi:threonine dehydrogenase-like Zn-dependent dehydrogenase
MRARQIRALGEPADALVPVDVLDAEPGPGQVLVRARAAGLNFADVLMCRGEYQVRTPLPYTPGIEVCGDGVAVGSDVSPDRIGQRVVGDPLTGGFAELALLDATLALPAPARTCRAGRRAGGRALDQLPDQLVRTAPPGGVASGRDVSRARRRGRRGQLGSAGGQGRRGSGRRRRRRRT